MTMFNEKPQLKKERLCTHIYMALEGLSARMRGMGTIWPVRGLRYVEAFRALGLRQEAPRFPADSGPSGLDLG